MTKKVLPNVLYAFCFLLLLFIIIVDVLPTTVLPTTTRIVFSAFAFLFVIAATGIKLSCLKNDEEKARAVKFSVWILFLFYLANLFMLLFIDMSYGRMAHPIFNANVDCETYFRWRTNLIPFKSIIEQLENFSTSNAHNFIVNIIGNLAAFAPMGLFVPIFFQRINNLLRFIVLIISMTVFVELMQFLTMAGSCDIDDVILNSIGAIIVYVTIRTKFVKTILEKLHLIV